jgi:hypothetical protein
VSRDEKHWAKPVRTLDLDDAPAGALNINVHGRRLSGAAHGFGKLWQKTFRIRLEGADVSPEEVVRTWKQRYTDFWPSGQRMYLPATGIAPGKVGLINASVPRGPTMATGVLVIYADDESFSFMAPLGHPFAGSITFSAHLDGGTTVVQVQEFIRASDPLYELGMAIGLARKQNETWTKTLENLARHFGASAVVQSEIVCVDSRWQWRYASNLWHNAAIRSGLYALARPLRWARAGRRSKGAR